MSDGKPEWHLDRKVPISLIIAVILQTLTFGVILGSFQERLTGLERAVAAQNDVSERLIRVETLMHSIDRRLERMEEKER